jgi:hypothetical protein
MARGFGVVVLLAALLAVEACQPPDCDHVDCGTCGNACCILNVTFRNRLSIIMLFDSFMLRHWCFSAECYRSLQQNGGQSEIRYCTCTCMVFVDTCIRTSIRTRVLQHVVLVHVITHVCILVNFCRW